MKRKIIFCLILLGISIILGCTSEPTTKTKSCGGAYVEYQGDCCLDQNYNYICDVYDLAMRPQYENTFHGGCRMSDIECSPRPGFRAVDDYEVCNLGCDRDFGKCVATDCKIVACIDDRQCRDGKRCRNFFCS